MCLLPFYRCRPVVVVRYNTEGGKERKSGQEEEEPLKVLSSTENYLHYKRQSFQSWSLLSSKAIVYNDSTVDSYLPDCHVVDWIVKKCMSHRTVFRETGSHGQTHIVKVINVQCPRVYSNARQRHSLMGDCHLGSF